MTGRTPHGPARPGSRRSGIVPKASGQAEWTGSHAGASQSSSAGQAASSSKLKLPPVSPQREDEAVGAEADLADAVTAGEVRAATAPSWSRR